MSGDDRAGAGGPQIHCHICSAALPQDATFCLQCGSRVRAVPPVPTPTAAGASAPPPPGPAPSRNATMLGMSASAMTAPSPNLGATMLEAHPAGSLVRPQHAPAAAATVPDAAPEPSPGGPEMHLPTAVANKARTMIGVARGGLALPPVPRSEPPAPSVPAPPTEPAAIGVPARSKTMMGVASPAVSSRPPPAQDPAATVRGDARRRRESPPFIGGERLGAAPPSFSPTYGPTPTEDDLRLPRRRSVAPWVLGAVVGLGVLGGAAVLGLRLLAPSGPPPLQAEVRLAEGALRVHATLPGADARWRVLYRGAEHPVDATGTVDFPLEGLDPNEVGEIVLPIDVRDGAGVRTARALRIVVGYRVVADFEHLGDDPPRVHLRFRVPAGARLAIAGQPITLSGQLGVAEIPAPPPVSADSPGASRSERFPIEVRTASGVVIRGEYDLRLPRLPLRVESPGPLSLVNASMVTVEGSLPRATRVLVGSQRAVLMGDHFRAEVPLGPGANVLTVHGFAPGGAPVASAITVYRSVTPQDYLASGGGDRGVAPLVRPSATPVRLRLRGRVINSTQAAGELPTFQLLVADRACPAQQCLAWVDMNPGTLVRVNETVEVVGETHGTRTYVNQTGQRRTDTVVRALFLTRP